MARKPARHSARKPAKGRKPAAKPRKPSRKPAPPATGPSRRLPVVAAIALCAAVLAVAAVVVLLPGEEAASPPVNSTRLPASPDTSPAAVPQVAAPQLAAPAVPPAVTPRPQGPAPDAVRAPAPKPAVIAPPPPQVAAVPPRPKPVWEQNAVPVAVAAGQPMIAVVIDDMGVDRGRSAQVSALPGPLTLAYLAYGDDLSKQTSAARKAGHELLVHVPMEPSGANADPGPNALLTELSEEELDRRIVWNLSQFDGFVGINNHMGSKATSDPVTMQAVMAELSRRGLLFLDSRTSGATVARDEAERAGIPALERDVFLDHDPSPVAVRAALLKTEKTAETKGYAIAIGHPKDATIAALAEWLPDVRRRGFAIVPVSALALRAGGAAAQ